MTRTPQELAQTVRERAAQWRAWATGERKQPPHQLLGFTTDVRALADEVERLAEAGEQAREALREVSNAYGCFAGCTGALPGAQTGTHTPSCRKARAALGEGS